MQPEELREFIQEVGYRTLTEIRQRFSDHPEEVIQMHLKYMMDKGMSRKIEFDSHGEREVLYYAPFKG